VLGDNTRVMITLSLSTTRHVSNPLSVNDNKELKNWRETTWNDPEVVLK